MNPIDWIVGQVSPEAMVRRARARLALQAMANYDAATAGRRASSWRPTGADADAAAARRARLAAVARDMIRNTPFAVRAQSVITSNVVGTGIIPKIKGGTKGQRADLLDLIESYCDTTAIDADGRNNLYGLQRIAMNAVIDAGEVLIRRRRRQRSDGLPIALQVQVIEADFIDASRDGRNGDNGNLIREGIEYDAIGRRVAYWLYDQHPGAAIRVKRNWTSRRVPASEILHVYRQDRPGQMRGVSWFAPVALQLQDEADHQDAQLMRQKIAACFAAFITDIDGNGATPSGEEPPASDPIGEKLSPGRIQRLQQGQDITFAIPPKVDGYDEFTRSVLRSVAAGLGVTYEALTGDLSNVNFTSYKAGRIEMDLNVQSWQWLMMVPQMLQPIGAWILEQWALERQSRPSRGLRMEWVPPVRPLIDPSREIGALRDKVRAGFASRQSVIRELGYDPERVTEEQIEDARTADAARLRFDSDARVATAGQPANPQPADPAPDGGQTTETTNG